MTDMDTQVITEIDTANGCEHLRYIFFKIDGYREAVSHDAFAHRGRNKAKHKGYLYHSQRKFEKDMSTDSFVKVMGYDIHKDVPCIHVKNIWEVYTLIGYDYKNKKWVDKP